VVFGFDGCPKIAMTLIDCQEMNTIGFEIILDFLQNYGSDKAILEAVTTFTFNLEVT
jgi:hypothetical protein